MPRPPASASAGITALILSLSTLLGQPGAAADAEYTWPLSLKRALSSTFGETRPPGGAPPTAFHAGIDLKTWGKTGYEVRALADGEVMRLRTSPWGYGRALYQRLNDGRIAVYAHLQGFAEPMATRVDRAQQETQRYTTDLWLEDGEIILRRGQVIAWSGQSGAGPPHLHLELRDEDNVPLNPLSHGFEVQDTTPPTIRSIALVPLGRGSSVDGEHRPVTVALRWDGKRRLYLAGATRPIVSGRIGIAVQSHDRADLAENRLAPYRHDLIVDGETVLSATYDEVGYDDAFQANMDRLRLGPRRTYANLFRLPGNRLGFYRVPGAGPEPASASGESAVSDGVLYCGTEAAEAGPASAAVLAKGEHRVEVVCLDAAGNSRAARLDLIVDAPPQIVSSRTLTEEEGSFLEAELHDRDDDFLHVTLATSPTGNDWQTVSRQRLSIRSGPFTWPLPASGQVVRLSVEDSTGASAFRTHARRALDAGGAAADPQGHLVLEQRTLPDFIELRIAAGQVLMESPVLSLYPSAVATATLRQTGLTEYRADIRFDPDASGSGQTTFEPSGPALPEPGGLGGAAADDELVATVTARSAATGERFVRDIALSATPVHPASPVTVGFQGGRIRLAFPRGSVYETIYPQATPMEVPSPEDAETPALEPGYAYRLGPTGVTFNRKVRIGMRIPGDVEDPGKLAVYVDGGGAGEWAFAGREVGEGAAAGYVAASVRSFGGRYALLADRTPPVVTELRPANGATVSADGPLVLSAAIGDGGSGIGKEEDIAMVLNGQRLISVYDPDADRVEYRSQGGRTQPGVYELVVTVTDQCGNEASGTSRFTVE